MFFEPTFLTPGVLPVWLDLGAVALGAVFGATLANSRQAPLIGVLLMGILLGFGGSMIRDILLNTDINALVHGRYITTAVVASFIGALLGDRLLRPTWMFTLLDTIVMGLFAVIGTEKALLFGMPISSSLFIGTLTAVGGGIIGDVLTGEKPDIMSRGPWSTSIALVTASWFIIWFQQDYVRFAELSSVVLCVTLRGLAIWRGWEAPHTEHLKPQTWIQRTKKDTAN